MKPEFDEGLDQMSMKAMRPEMERLLDATKATLAAGGEPPWSWYQLMKLRETLEAILASTLVTQPLRVVGKDEEPAVEVTLPM